MTLKEHPPFADYVSGVLWEHENVEGGGQLPDSPEQLAEMKNRFPPRELKEDELGLLLVPTKAEEADKEARPAQSGTL